MMKGQVDISQIYDDYSLRLYNIGLRITGDASDAEEVMHDTLLKFLSYIVEMTPAEHAAVPPTSVMREFIGGSSLKY